MIRSTDRILTTHVGALSRPPGAAEELMAFNTDRSAAGGEQLRSAVAEVVSAQIDAGLDSINDGEFGKSVWHWYAPERLNGVERQEVEGWVRSHEHGRDRAAFPGFYAYADEHPEVLLQAADEPFVASMATQPVAVGPISYDTTAVERDIANLRAALEGHEGVTEAFMPVAAPVSIQTGMGNEHYDSDEDLLWAIAEAMKEEYRAIVNAGFTLQVDDAWIPVLWDHEEEPPDMAAYREKCARANEALIHALEGIPEESVRYHLCWGSWHGPHSTDVPLKEIVDLMLSIPAATYLIESANAAHEHEYRVWEETELPDGKVLAPGVVSHHTNLIENPELVAQRIKRFADVVGRERVIASTDCGMGSRLHPELGWAKLEALTEGARLASAELWRG